MSLYNMINGANPATFFILPMLGERHPETYPRFRDCFVNKENGKPEIHLYTRVGGGNRGGYGEEELYKHPNFIKTWDDEFDSTYGYYSFSVPEEWKSDFEKIMDDKLIEISDAYKQRLYAIFPKLKETFDKLFSPEEELQKDKNQQP